MCKGLCAQIFIVGDIDYAPVSLRVASAIRISSNRSPIITRLYIPHRVHRPDDTYACFLPTVLCVFTSPYFFSLFFFQPPIITILLLPFSKSSLQFVILKEHTNKDAFPARLANKVGGPRSVYSSAAR